MQLLNTNVYEEKKSKFLGFLYSIESEEEHASILKTLKEEHKDSKHILHVCRYISHQGAKILTSSDDREPISSMKKASRFFERDDIFNVGIYIVRYYGGKELGASHLDHVYFQMTMNLYNYYKRGDNNGKK